MGHAGHASGFVSLVKLLCILETGVIPATANFSTPHPLMKYLVDGSMKVKKKKKQQKKCLKQLPWTPRICLIHCSYIRLHSVSQKYVFIVTEVRERCWDQFERLMWPCVPWHEFIPSSYITPDPLLQWRFFLRHPVYDQWNGLIHLWQNIWHPQSNFTKQQINVSIYRAFNMDVLTRGTHYWGCLFLGGRGAQKSLWKLCINFRLVVEDKGMFLSSDESERLIETSAGQ